MSPFSENVIKNIYTLPSSEINITNDLREIILFLQALIRLIPNLKKLN